MESNFVVTLVNAQTSEIYSRRKSFITFEEAVIYANRVRNKMGHDWSTTSIVKIMENEVNARSFKKT